MNSLYGDSIFTVCDENAMFNSIMEAGNIILNLNESSGLVEKLKEFGRKVMEFIRNIKDGIKNLLLKIKNKFFKQKAKESINNTINNTAKANNKKPEDVKVVINFGNIGTAINYIHELKTTMENLNSTINNAILAHSNEKDDKAYGKAISLATERINHHKKELTNLLENNNWFDSKFNITVSQSDIDKCIDLYTSKVANLVEVAEKIISNTKFERWTSEVMAEMNKTKNKEDQLYKNFVSYGQMLTSVINCASTVTKHSFKYKINDKICGISNNS